jgi:Na+-transporting NADH:ubiquinone oxidoreductase subunit A
MAKNVKISKGVDIKLVGKAEEKLGTIESTTVALKPTDFHGIIPKLEVKEGDEVKAGTPLFHDKSNNKIKFVSPVSGEVAAVVRGAKRRILEVRVLADKETKFEEFNVSAAASADKPGIIEILQNGGQWPLIKKRPFDVMADSNEEAKAIFISAFDSSPLAPDYNFILKDRAADLQAGIDALAKLTKGAVNIVTRGDKGVFGGLSNCTIHSIAGPHPAGNVGVQMHHIEPLNKGEVVWTVNAQDLAAMGSFLNTGRIQNTRVITLTGAEVKAPQYYTIVLGSSAESIAKGNINAGARFISGNVLTGDKVEEAGYVGYYHHQVTAIREDHEAEFFGWVAPGFDKFSLSKTFFSWAMPNKKYNLGTGIHGEERAFVMTGQYEKVFPFDIYPVQLLKSIIINDIEQMENLGIYEVAPEDFALCEFGCTSKINSQEIVRNGLDLIKSELS